MTLKITFLGSGSAFTVGDGNYHSNLLFQKDDDTMLIDAGSDIRLSLHDIHLNYKDIRSVYISHLHADHVGGLEWLAFNTHFDPLYQGKPILFASEHIINDLWNHSLAGGLTSLQTETASLNTYFNVHSINEHEQFVWNEINFKLVQTVHVVSDHELVPCYGLLFNYNNSRIYFTADTQCALKQLPDYYDEATIIFHDCETAEHKSGVHAHYSELVKLPAKLKKKMWLYHYNPGKLPDAEADGFLGFVKRGQTFVF